MPQPRNQAPRFEAPGRIALAGALASLLAFAGPGRSAELLLDPQHLACLDYANDEPEAALQAARDGIARGGGWAAAHCEAMALLALGRPEEAAPKLEALGAQPSPGIERRAFLLRDAARAYLAADQALAAVSAATRGLILAPDDLGLLTERAIAAASSGDVYGSIDDLNRAVDLDPANAPLLVLRAAAWRRAVQPALARDDANRALELDPRNAEAYLELGLLARSQGDEAGARFAFRRVRELGPGTPADSLAQRHLEQPPPGPARR